ncbi:hypothetical protein BW41_02280 [Sphingomonas sp. RIT328]|nr:hypothetical protein BW41_02280 [Sphingomonas sp. RIT328]
MMNPGLAGLFAGGVAGVYVPTLRDQIRDGRIEMPLGGINPIGVRRDEHPLAFLLCSVAMVGCVAILLIVSAILVVRAFLS